jgi:hypothetical protein
MEEFGVELADAEAFEGERLYRADGGGNRTVLSCFSSVHISRGKREDIQSFEDS